MASLQTCIDHPDVTRWRLVHHPRSGRHEEVNVWHDAPYADEIRRAAQDWCPSSRFRLFTYKDGSSPGPTHQFNTEQELEPARSSGESYSERVAVNALVEMARELRKFHESTTKELSMIVRDQMKANEKMMKDVADLREELASGQSEWVNAVEAFGGIVTEHPQIAVMAGQGVAQFAGKVATALKNKADEQPAPDSQGETATLPS